MDVQPALAFWPQPTFAGSFADTGASTGTLTLTVGMPDGTDTHGETFDLSGGSLDCGNAHLDLSYADITPGKPITFDSISGRHLQQRERAVHRVYGGSWCRTPARHWRATRCTGAGHVSIVRDVTGDLDRRTDTRHLGNRLHRELGRARHRRRQTCRSPWPTPARRLDLHRRVRPELDFPALNREYERRKGGSSTASSVRAVRDDLGRPLHLRDQAAPIWSVAITFNHFGQTPRATPIAGHGREAFARSIRRPDELRRRSWTSNSASNNAQVQIHYTGPYNDSTLSSLNWNITITSSDFNTRRYLRWHVTGVPQV